LLLFSSKKKKQTTACIIVVALDFGTTFSGVAWAQVTNPNEHYIINQWPSSVSSFIDGMTSEKVPTEVAFTYDGVTPKVIWGFQIPEAMPHKAKAQTLTCAEEAGLGAASNIRIISEPEATVIHVLKASNPHGLEIDDTIVLCDARVGMVDLITFTIVELRPTLRLQEAAPGAGGLSDSTFLDKRFEDFLQRRLSYCEGWESDTIEQAMLDFETVAKRRFAGDLIDDFVFPVPGIADNKDLGV
ncbi:actin-like ATPase domain-containing protein, partial [Penicillium alfredii]